eukprot:4378231-Pleurochrysis_carterae.AAC.1
MQLSLLKGRPPTRWALSRCPLSNGHRCGRERQTQTDERRATHTHAATMTATHKQQRDTELDEEAKKKEGTKKGGSQMRTTTTTIAKA